MANFMPFLLLPVRGWSLLMMQNDIDVGIWNATATKSDWDSSGECREEEKEQVLLLSNQSNQYATAKLSLTQCFL